MHQITSNCIKLHQTASNLIISLKFTSLIQITCKGLGKCLKSSVPGGWPDGWVGGWPSGWVAGWLDQMEIRLKSASVEVEVYMVELWLCIRYSRKINYSGWWGGWVAGWVGGWRSWNYNHLSFQLSWSWSWSWAWQNLNSRSSFHYYYSRIIQFFELEIALARPKTQLWAMTV